MLSRYQILNSNDRKVSSVETPEWGGSTQIRTLSHAERSRLNSRIQKMRGTDKESEAGGLMAATIICDAFGERIFTDEDAGVLSEKNGAVLDRIVDAYRDLNAVTPKDAGLIEKNS